MKRNPLKILLSLIFVVILVLGCGNSEDASEESQGQDDASNDSSSEDANNNEPFLGTFSTGSAGGVYGTLGAGLSNVINQNSEFLNLDPTTPSSVSVVPQMLTDGEAVLGFGMVDLIDRAIKGEGEFDVAYEDLSHVMALYDNVMATYVLEESDITNVNQASGLKVGVPSESTKTLMAEWFELAGVPESDIDWVYLSYGEQADAVRDGNIDIGTITAYPRNAMIEDLNATKGIRILETDDDVIDAWNEKNPMMRATAIPGGTYDGHDEDIEFYTQFTALYTSDEVPEHVIYEVVKQILENREEVLEIHPAAETIVPEKTAEYLDEGFLYKLHPGAEKYFTEAGVID